MFAACPRCGDLAAAAVKITFEQWTTVGVLDADRERLAQIHRDTSTCPGPEPSPET